MRNDLDMNHFIHSIFYQPKDLKKAVLYKEVRNFNEIEGTYQFNCKYPEIYSMGIGFKEKFYLTTNQPLKNKSKTTYEIYVDIKIIDKNNIIYSKKNTLVVGDAIPHSKIDLVNFNLLNCKNKTYTLQIDYIDSEIIVLEKDKMYFYIEVNTNK